MIWAYGSQIFKLYKSKRTEGLSIKFYVFAFFAVVLRMTTIGMVIKQTWNISAIALEIAEITVFAGLLIIFLQILLYRRKKRTTQR
ncbi:PQ-loop repeat-containing protein [Patescibacteria group bacterium]|nr:PQ-loop repeat-containing protein [Patescibacteria group bacterium]